MPFKSHGNAARITLIITVGLTIMYLLWYSTGLKGQELNETIRPYINPLLTCIKIQVAALIAALFLTFSNRGKLAQTLLFVVTISISVIYFWYYGFVLMEKANMILRFLSVTQVSIVISTLIVNTVIDVFLFKNAKEVGGIQWGKIPNRAQYALLLLCVAIVTLMGLMGFIRSGLRMNWHIYGFMQDKSPGAFTPSIAYMGWVVSLIVFLFLALVAAVFWLATLGDKKKKHA
ncbi:MAG TPA: hypothetical protein QF423_07635, partial [Candidatus Scalindua sp.]|nr:hypothetical protein [Candidatus Scalindua sp.]